MICVIVINLVVDFVDVIINKIAVVVVVFLLDVAAIYFPKIIQDFCFYCIRNREMISIIKPLKAYL